MRKPKYEDDLDAPIWGAAAMAPIVRRSVRQVYHLIETGHLDVTHVGARIVSTPRRLLRSIGALDAPGEAPAGEPCQLMKQAG